VFSCTDASFARPGADDGRTGGVTEAARPQRLAYGSGSAQTGNAPEGTPRVSVLMPTFDHAPFIRRAIESLRAQTLTDWELVIVDDGSSDAMHEVTRPDRTDPRCSYHRSEENRGLGAALNLALAHARAPYVAYLPSDDLYYPAHLAALVALLERDPDAVLAYSGVRHHGHSQDAGQIDGLALQLVQVVHRRTGDRWIERDEVVTDDLERMFWSRLRPRGRFTASGDPTCEWVDHPQQRHKLIRESLGGGVNRYRGYYQVRQPLRFQSSEGDPLDEAALYRQFRARPAPVPGPDRLKILIVGELAFNPERILALEERGHQLYGLWTPDGIGFNTVGPLPFGHVEDLPRSGWREAVRRIRPDVIYALLNWHAVPFAHEVLLGTPGVPFVWHFKESPFACLERGLWPQLVDLHTRSDGQVYISPEMQDWFETALPGQVVHDRTLVLDGDLPKREWFTHDRRPRLSRASGEIHTVVAGRPFGIHPDTMGELARAGIHMHFYGPTWGPWWRDWIARTRCVASGHLHLHPTARQPDWVPELSQYDAGWLHLFESRNGGDVRRANWDDLNYPARLSTLIAAGLPLIQPDHGDAVVATAALVRRLQIGVTFRDFERLRAQLADEQLVAPVRENVWRQREQFTFDHHVDRLVAFFRRVIATRARGR